MNITIQSYALGPLQTNAYIVSNETGRAVIIDPGFEGRAFMERVKELDVEAIVLTHAHFDHIGAVEAIRSLKQCPVYLHDAEAEWLADPDMNGSALWPDVGAPIIINKPAEYGLDHNMKLKLLGETFHVLHTPGHSPGSVSLVWNGNVFSGDVLFKLGVGRTDLYGGSSKELYDSIEMLFGLPPQTIVHPGHGPRTAIGYEKENNPYV